MNSAAVIANRGDLDRVLARIAGAQRMVFVSGLPGVGKSLFSRELARLAYAAGRRVHLIQWDVMRLSFASPQITARYPERAGLTQAIIRKAAGQWARDATLRWHQEHGSEDVLIGEVPLIGHRLLELAQVKPDAAELLLAGEDTLFVTPVPSVEVRAVIVSARDRTHLAPAHPRERADAAPSVVDATWRELHALGESRGFATAAPDGHPPFDPQVYAAAYRHLLRHRQALTLWVNVPLETRTSVYELDVPVRELVPTPDEASAVLRQLEREQSVAAIEQDVAGWFDRV